MPEYHLEVSVTEKCNLGCPYCYVANQDKFMTPEVFDNAWPEFIKLVDRSRSHAQGKFHITFFGGEPLLNMDLIKHATHKVRNDSFYSHRLHALSIISNMTLINDEIADWLEENQVGISWSFDGISSNETRPVIKNMGENKGYSSVFEMYNEKQHLIRRLTKYSKTCKVMIFPGNVDAMTENFEFLVEFGIPCPDFSVVRDDIWSVDDLHNFRREVRRLADKQIEYLSQGKLAVCGLFNLPLQDMLIGLTKQKRPFGCFAGVSGSVMAVDGSFYPCARFGSKKVLPMKGDEYNFQYYQTIFNPKTYNKCKGCELYKVCNAGCTYSQIRNGNKPVDSICELFHMYYDEAIRIVDKCKDFPTFQDYIGKLFKGRDGFYTPFDIEEKKDLFDMLDHAKSNHSKHQEFLESLPA
tara:strand:- start:2893 stop:4122 length:1230 start_codon:yes stop_codon:yes gene_type:complete